jgi:hypothetical protein
MEVSVAWATKMRERAAMKFQRFEKEANSPIKATHADIADSAR